MIPSTGPCPPRDYIYSQQTPRIQKLQRSFALLAQRCLASTLPTTTAMRPYTRAVCLCPRPPAPARLLSAAYTMAASWCVLITSTSPMARAGAARSISKLFPSPSNPLSFVRLPPIREPPPAPSSPTRTARSCTTLRRRFGARAPARLPTPSSRRRSSPRSWSCTRSRRAASRASSPA